MVIVHVANELLNLTCNYFLFYNCFFLYYKYETMAQMKNMTHTKTWKAKTKKEVLHLKKIVFCKM